MAFDSRMLRDFADQLQEESKQWFGKANDRTFEISKLIIGLSSGGLAATSIFITEWIWPLFALLLLSWFFFLSALIAGLFFMVELRNAALYHQTSRDVWAKFVNKAAEFVDSDTYDKEMVENTIMETGVLLQDTEDSVIKGKMNRSKWMERVMKWGFLSGILLLLIFGSLYMQVP